jgi:integrase
MSRTPQLCRHRGRSLGYVTLGGREHYLGHWPAEQRKPPPAVRAAYDELVARWLAHGRRLPDETTQAPVTMNEVLLGFIKYAQGHYRERSGNVCGEVEAIKQACAVVRVLYGRTPAAEFGPKALKVVRARMIEKGWCRSYVNKQVNRVKRMFRWATAEEMIPASVIHGLTAVPAIRKGEPGIRESEPVKPVPEAHVEAALPFMPRPVAAMVELQRLTGMRPGEVVILRGCDLDVTGRVWVYRPHYHKTEHRGQSREVYLGPRAQAVLKPWLRTNLEACLFSPAEAENQHHAERSANRKTPAWPSHMKRNATKRMTKRERQPGEHYTPDSYGRAIVSACRKADRAARREALEHATTAEEVEAVNATVYVPEWRPNRLRHNAATGLRKEFGIEMARIVLGHSTAFTTEIYAEADRVQALDAVLKVG